MLTVAFSGGAMSSFVLSTQYLPNFYKENILLYILIVYDMTSKQSLLCLEQQGNLMGCAHHRFQVSDLNKENLYELVSQW